jgi:hypothetical protein
MLDGGFAHTADEFAAHPVPGIGESLVQIDLDAAKP